MPGALNHTAAVLEGGGGQWLSIEPHSGRAGGGEDSGSALNHTAAVLEGGGEDSGSALNHTAAVLEGGGHSAQGEGSCPELNCMAAALKWQPKWW